ncbi:hypothetical protein EWM64_g6549 [Hericium alpestre]|uniref:Reverse transcriptase domain-containing protein n=1 Tax=Hericium alpestre TaxID=135208 RepID=A0A4Y9ZT86_9AGAM|nr:hypothetical protein EWM64_g6549 [Hericium alpestre]
MLKTSVNMATFSQDAITKPPILSAGEISPETLVSWDDGARGYFAHKSIKEADQVCLISYGFQDPRICQWIRLKQAELFTLSYDDFLDQVCKKWLPRNWAFRLSNALLNACQGSTPFAAWQLDMQMWNALLVNTSAHLSDDALRRKLESGVHEDVATVLHRKDYSTLSFQDWLDKVTVIDEEHIALADRVAIEAAILQRRAELSRLPPLLSASRAANSGTSQASSQVTSQGMATKPCTVPLAKLSDTEHKLLLDHEGCLKCHRFYVTHPSLDCPNGFPDPVTYKTLTESAAKVASKKPIIAVVMPTSEDPSCILGSGSESEGSCVSKDSGFNLLCPSPVPVSASVPVSHPVLSPMAMRHANHVKMDALGFILVSELKARNATCRADIDHRSEIAQTQCCDIVTAVRQHIEALATAEHLCSLDQKLKKQFADCFPDDVPPVHCLPTDVVHWIQLKTADFTIKKHNYTCPHKYLAAWKVLLDQHLAAGRIRPSTSPYVSPSFIVPKADPKALPRWVNDYCWINTHTIPDNFPLPRIKDILANCTKGKIWGKIDMTNSFFQTPMHPDDIKYTAVSTPFGPHEWTVMPMGSMNVLPTHQRRMVNALRHLIGKICHVYMDDIIIWSQDLAEHERNVASILKALRAASLYCNPKKTDLFCLEVTFLSHHISAASISADKSKVDKILNWPVPKSASDVRSFLGLVCYISAFLPALAEHTAVLTPLTTKEAEKSWPMWTNLHADTFEAIKQLVISCECLTVIDHDNPGNNQIFVTCDASDRRTGACLSFGPTWETARPIAFDSMQLTAAQQNYPVHEKELLTIVRMLDR